MSGSESARIIGKEVKWYLCMAAVRSDSVPKDDDMVLNSTCFREIGSESESCNR